MKILYLLAGIDGVWATDAIRTAPETLSSLYYYF